MEYRDRIHSSNQIMLGKPVIKGTRITVETILRKLSEGMSIEEMEKAFPTLRKDDIYACLAYSADVISNEAIIAS